MKESTKTVVFQAGKEEYAIPILFVSFLGILKKKVS